MDFGKNKMLEIPFVTSIDLILGNKRHLPNPDLISQNFWDDFKSRRTGKNPFLDFAETMYYVGLNDEEIKRLLPKEGVYKEHALNAVKSIMRANKLEDEMKIVSSAFMLSEWFDIRTTLS